MKKSILLLLSLLLIITLFSSCELDNYQQKKLIVENKSEANISGINLTYYDYSPISARSMAFTPIISPNGTKEYSLPYLNNQGRSSQWKIRVEAYVDEEGGQSIVDSRDLLFTFNTTSNDDIVITFDFDESESEYTLEGRGSGYQRIMNET